LRTHSQKKTTADRLSAALVGARLAACVNIVPGLTSIYWWEGKVNRDSELLLVIKGRSERLDDLTAAVRFKLFVFSVCGERGAPHPVSQSAALCTATPTTTQPNPSTKPSTNKSKKRKTDQKAAPL
jgi:hypothetical protein